MTQESLFEFTAPANIDGRQIPSRIVGTRAGADQDTDRIARGMEDYVLSHHRNGEELRIDDTDVPALLRATVRVLALLLDHKPHDFDEIYKITRQRECLRRTRELRKFGFNVECSRKAGRDFVYTLGAFNPSALGEAGCVILKAAKAVRS